MRARETSPTFCINLMPAQDMAREECLVNGRPSINASNDGTVV